MLPSSFLFLFSFFSSPLNSACKIKEKGGGSLEFPLVSQHKQYVHLSTSDFFLEPKLKILGCKQLLVIKAGVFVLLFCKQSGLPVNMEMIYRSFASIRPDSDLLLLFHCKTQIRSWMILKQQSFNPEKSQFSFLEGGKSSVSPEGCVVPWYLHFLLGF